jgi:hypothetical protein
MDHFESGRCQWKMTCHDCEQEIPAAEWKAHRTMENNAKELFELGRHLFHPRTLKYFQKAASQTPDALSQVRTLVERLATHMHQTMKQYDAAHPSEPTARFWGLTRGRGALLNAQQAIALPHLQEEIEERRWGRSEQMDHWAALQQLLQRQAQPNSTDQKQSSERKSGPAADPREAGSLVSPPSTPGRIPSALLGRAARRGLLSAVGPESI